MISNEDQERSVVSLLRRAQSDKVFGKLTVSLQGGNVTWVELSRSFNQDALELEARNIGSSDGEQAQG